MEQMTDNVFKAALTLLDETIAAERRAFEDALLAHVIILVLNKQPMPRA
jgi:hypothetical protein